MSVKVMSAIWERKDLDASERLLLLSLADHADDEGYCYPSIKRLCERTSLAERTVQGTIKKLVLRGFLTVRYGQGRNGTNAFIVNTTPAADAPPQNLHPAADAPRKICATPPQNLRHPPAAAAPKPSLNHQEPSEDPPLVPPKRKQAIPQNWVPSDRNIADATARQFSAKEIEDEAARFRDYHLANGSTFKDWDAAWRTWLGNARRFAPRRSDNSSAFLRTVARAAGAF